MIRYDISPLDPEAHLYIVGITIDDPTPDEQYLRLPAWIAGSYLIRDFASTVQAEQAFLGETPVPIEKVDKTTWRVSTVGRKADEELFVCTTRYGLSTPRCADATWTTAAAFSIPEPL